MHNSCFLRTDNHKITNIITKDQNILHEVLNSLEYKSYDGLKQGLKEFKKTASDINQEVMDQAACLLSGSK